MLELAPSVLYGLVCKSALLGLKKTWHLSCLLWRRNAKQMSLFLSISLPLYIWIIYYIYIHVIYILYVFYIYTHIYIIYIFSSLTVFDYKLEDLILLLLFFLSWLLLPFRLDFHLGLLVAYILFQAEKKYEDSSCISSLQ